MSEATPEQPLEDMENEIDRLKAAEAEDALLEEFEPLPFEDGHEEDTDNDDA